ncbi:MAG: ATPase, T2SS/T4P/T4SS family [Bacteriovoracaceae bacterium]|jgi:pilus assembly protein CpaF|nr:ATPase, T2SS/T4P/T4SS family [Bacteriovoracaceae bacterium]
MNPENEVNRFLSQIASMKDVTEVIINDWDNIYIEKAGKLTGLNKTLSKSSIVDFCKEVAVFNKSSFNLNSPIIDGSLPDGSRVNIISSLYTGTCPAITIRKYLKSIETFDSKENIFGLDERWIEFIRHLVSSKCNILISGGTGRGKTTFLNLLLQEVSPAQRIITIEDTKELNFDKPNTVRLLAKSNTFDIQNPLTTRDLLKNSLRMRPDRIIIGEVRGAEAFDLLQAMNTGHEGSMCTIHATTPADCLSRLENLFLFSGIDMPLRAIRMQVCNAIDYIIQLDKDSDGNRVVSEFSEVCGMEGDTILTQKIGTIENGALHFTGIVPKRMKRLVQAGLPTNFFIDF